MPVVSCKCGFEPCRITSSFWGQDSHGGRNILAMTCAIFSFEPLRTLSPLILTSSSRPLEETHICLYNDSWICFANNSPVSEILEGTGVSIDDSESVTKTPIRHPTGILYVHLLLWQQQVVIRSSSLYVLVLSGIRFQHRRILTAWTI